MSIMRKSWVSCVSRIVPGIMRKSTVNQEYHAYFLHKAWVSCVLCIIPGIMRKSRVNEGYHAYILRKSWVSCIKHGYHEYHALYQVSRVNHASIKVKCHDVYRPGSSRISRLHSQVLQSPSSCRRLGQTCAVYCFEFANNGISEFECSNFF